MGGAPPPRPQPLPVCSRVPGSRPLAVKQASLHASSQNARERLPRPSAWPLQVSNGVVGSAAFAAYDAGFDVW